MPAAGLRDDRVVRALASRLAGIGFVAESDANPGGGGPGAEIGPGLNHSGGTGRHQEIHGNVEILCEGLAACAGISNAAAALRASL